MTSLPDLRHFMGTLSLKKAANASVLLHSYFRSRLTGDPRIPAWPFTISVEPTTHCNLRCPECPSGLRSFSRATGRIELPLFKKIIDEMQDHLIFLYFYFQGEPFLHPQFSDMIRYASARGVYTVTSTNGHYLNDDRAKETVESGLSRIIISVDGTTQESYAQYRKGGRLDIVLEGALRLAHWKRKLQSHAPHIIFQMIVFRHNEKETEEFRHLAKAFGADEVLLKTAQIYNADNAGKMLPEKEKFSRYVFSGNRLMLKHPLHNRCWKLWHSSVITWDGKVVPCCFDKDARYVMGDLTNQSFREVWNSAPYLQFRRKLLHSRQTIDICSNCSEGALVWA
ncbi:MAG: radical SAM protein [Chitinophagales bacterium]|nr:MAG: radical SAM protein [Chitinophagales bacterium]